MLLLALACYWPGLDAPPLLDDEPQVLPLVRSLDPANWTQLAPRLLMSRTGPGGRPVAMASLIASTVAHGNDLRAFHRENVLLHLLCATVLLGTLRALRRGLALRGRPPPGDEWSALFGAGFWLFHPLLLSSVLYTVQRMTELSTLFTLCGLWAYAAARNRDIDPARRCGGTGALLALCFLVFLPLAVFSKENGALLIPMCALVEWCVYGGAGSAQQRRRLRGVFGLLLVLPVALALTVLAPTVFSTILGGYQLRDFSLEQRLLTEARVWWYYIGEWLWPGGANLSFFHDDFKVSRGFWSPWNTLPALLGLALLTGLAVRLRHAQPLVALGILVFLCGHLIEGSVVALELVFEHRNYLSGAGFAIALCALPRPRQVPRYLAVLAACAILAGLAARTAARAAVWNNSWSLFTALYQANPDSPRLAAFFANNYTNGGSFDQAHQMLARQHTPGARLQDLDIDCMARRTLEADRLQAALTGLQGVVGAYETQEIVHLVNDALGEHCGVPLVWARALVDRALSLPVSTISSRQLLLLYRGHLDHALGDNEAAQLDLLHSAAADRDNPLPLLLSAEWALAAHDTALAQRRLDEARAVPDAVGGEYQDLIDSLAQRVVKEHR